MRSKQAGREERAFQIAEVRLREEDGRPPVIVGHAAVFDEFSEDLGGFRERIQPGAFTKTLQEADVRALWNHDPNYVLGRTKNGTLSLREDKRGLAFEVTPPETQWASDCLVSIRRGDVDQMSFGFHTVRDEWTKSEDDQITRTLIEVALYDVSPVTFPAYPQTNAEVRAKVSELQQATAAPGQEPHPAGADASQPRARLGQLRRRLDLAEQV